MLQSLFVYRLRNYKDLEAVVEELSAIADKKIILEIYNMAIQEPYSFLYVALRAKSKNDMFHLRFDKKITIKIMPNFIRVQGFYVPMSGSTAAKVAQHYGLSLPPSQLIRQINQNADIKITSKPLSGTGAIIDGKKYSGNDIVNLGVGRSDFAGAYNDTINKQLAEHGDTSGKVISGFAKEIAAPTPGNEGTLHMVGFFDKNGSPHIIMPNGIPKTIR